MHLPREKDKWSTHYDSERVTHLRGMHCECGNSIGAHHAVISTVKDLFAQRE